MYIIWWACFCSGGIGDRILGMATTLCIAQILGYKFLVKWDYTDMGNIFRLKNEYNYYTYNTPYKYIEFNNESAKEYFRNFSLEEWGDNNLLFWSNQNLFQHFLQNKIMANFILSDEAYISLISTSTRKIINEIFDLLPDIPRLISCYMFDIGIHIRTHDSAFESNKKDMEQYITDRLLLVKKDLKDENTLKIFLASDTEKTFDIASKIFQSVAFVKGEIIHSGKEYGKDQNGLEKVFTDLMCLSSKCKKLYIGWHTNFSRISCLYDTRREFLCHEDGKELKKVDCKELCNYFSESGKFRM